jgi:hypothetical protein
MPRSEMSGHQKACAEKPNVERMLAAGTSSSTPYYVNKCQASATDKGKEE